MRYLNRNIENIYGFLMSILFISLPFPSPVITNIVFGLLIALVLFFTIKNGVNKLQANQKKFYFLLVIFTLLLLIPSMIYDADMLNNKTTRPIYFLIIPLVLFLGPDIGKNQLQLIKRNFVIGVILFSFIGFLKMLYLYYMQMENKIFFDSFETGLKIHTTSFAYLTVLAFSFIIHKLFFDRNKKVGWHIFSAFYLLTLLFLIATRIAFLAVFVILIVTVIQGIKKINYKKGLLYFGLITIVISIFAFNGYFSERVENIYSSNIDNRSDIENRLIIWNCALEVFDNNTHKLFGDGITNSNQLLQDCYYQKDFFGKDLGYHAHNQYLQILISGGIAGFIIFLILMGYIFYEALISRNHFLMMTVLIFAIFFITESVFEQQIGVTTFTLFVSLFLNRNARIINQPE